MPNERDELLAAAVKVIEEWEKYRRIGPRLADMASCLDDPLLALYRAVIREQHAAELVTLVVPAAGEATADPTPRPPVPLPAGGDLFVDCPSRTYLVDGDSFKGH